MDSRVWIVETRLREKWFNFAFIICFQECETTPKLKVRMPHQGGQRRFFMRRFVPQNRLRCESTSRRTPSAVLDKEHKHLWKRLSRNSESCLNNVDMTLMKVIGLYFPISFLTIGNDPVDYRTDAVSKGLIHPLTGEEAQHCRLIWGTQVRNVPRFFEQASRTRPFGVFITFVKWHHTSLLGTYLYLWENLIPFFSGNNPLLWDEFTHLYREFIPSLTILHGFD